MDLRVGSPGATLSRGGSLLDEAVQSQTFESLVPGLMLGTAGIAYSAARLLRPSLKCVLTCLV